MTCELDSLWKEDACAFYRERESMTAVYIIVATDIIYAYVTIIIANLRMNYNNYLRNRKEPCMFAG